MAHVMSDAEWFSYHRPYYDGYVIAYLPDDECDTIVSLAKRRIQEIDADPSPTRRMERERDELFSIVDRFRVPRTHFEYVPPTRPDATTTDAP